jgi:3-acetyloctanal synthase
MEARIPVQRQLVVAVVTEDGAFFAAALGALGDVAGGGLAVESDRPLPAGGPEAHPLYVEALAKARRYVEKSGPLAVTVVQAGSFDGAAEKLAALAGARPDPAPLGMLYADAASAGMGGGAASLDESMEAFYERLASSGVPALRSPYTTAVHVRTPPWSDGSYALPDRYVLRIRGADPELPWLLRTELLCLLLDFLERTFDNRRHQKSALREDTTTLGHELARFLRDRAGASWLLLYHTSTAIIGLVDHLERVARAEGVLALRGPNEHALACGALAAFQLHRRPFLLLVGNAMIDELRGTFANLRSAGVKGFLVCPEAEPGRWFGFQATVSGDEDTRAVLAARRIPSVYVERPEVLGERLAEAFRLYEAERGPVVLLVTQAVIDAHGPLAEPPAYPQRAEDRPRVELAPAQDDALTAALAILGRERTRVLLQCGPLDEEEADLVHAIAERAGIALVDTLGHPGSVSAYRHGRRVPGYLGTLGLYGFNQRVHAFLHPDGKLPPRSEQCLFFLKSKVGQRATNFTPARRAGLRMVQVTHRADHVAPDVELALVMEARDFLRRTLARLEVDPEVLRHRKAAIGAAAAPGEDLASRLPSLPMSPNYFFRELGLLVERMIEEDGYAYTGVYDVGRCCVSATRTVPRTGPGFSGWYGRALMGDAPMAVPALAVVERGNVLAFAGDGAKALTADPLPSFVENALAYPERAAEKNVTVFTLANGTFSGIRSYRERLASKWGGRQMRAIDLLDPEGEQTLGPLHVVRRTLARFDPAELREALLARGRLNLFTVLLGHNNEDDGFTLVNAGWQREAP